MSPYAGESPLSLLFGIIFALIGVLIFGVLVWRMVPQWLARRRIKRARAQVGALPAELQQRIDRLYTTRGDILNAMDASSAYGMREVDVFARRIGGALGHGVRASHGVAQGVDENTEFLDALERDLGAVQARVADGPTLQDAELDEILAAYPDVDRC